MRQLERPGRNEACFCGSGKKFKKCHWPEIMEGRGVKPKQVRTPRKTLAAPADLEDAFEYVHGVRREIQVDPRVQAFLDDGVPHPKWGNRVVFVETHACLRNGAPRGLAVVYDAGTNAGWQIGSRNADEHFAKVAALAEAMSERIVPARLDIEAVASALAEVGIGMFLSQVVMQFEWTGDMPVDVVVFKLPQKPGPTPGPLAQEFIRQGGGKIASPEELEALDRARDDPAEEEFVADARRRAPKRRVTSGPGH